MRQLYGTIKMAWTRSQVFSIYSILRAPPSRNSKISVFGPNQPAIEAGLKKEVWIRAVLKGLNEKSPQWRHLLPLGGMLLAFIGQGQQDLTPNLRSDLDECFVVALNSVTSNPYQSPEEYCATFVMGHVFDLLPEWRRNEIHHDVGT